MFLLLVYLLLTLPFRWVIKRTNNYNRSISLRKFCNVLLYVFVVGGVISVAHNLLLKGISSSIYEYVGKAIFILCFLPIYYLWAKSLLNVVDFYDEKIIDRLQYFILYLRSFKDDKRKNKEELKYMEMMYKLFCPYAVGVPSEFSPSEGAPRIYIAEKWQEQVGILIQKAPIILFRINETPNFLWEVEFCLDQNMLRKSLFWIANKENYHNFSIFMKGKGVNLPAIESQQINSILYFNDNGIKIVPIKTQKQREKFIENYIIDKAELLKPYDSYLFGRNNKLKLFISNRYPKELIPEVKSWSLTAFILPAFYTIFHSFPYRILSYLAILMLDVILVLSTIGITGIIKKGSIALSVLYVLLVVLIWGTRLMLSYFMGRNAKTMVWLSEKWSSIEEYNTAQKQATLITCMFGIILLLLVICMFI